MIVICTHLTCNSDFNGYSRSLIIENVFYILYTKFNFVVVISTKFGRSITVGVQCKTLEGRGRGHYYMYMYIYRN